MTPTLSLSAADMDAYLPEKATSNAFSRPRLEVKQRALAWAKGVVARLAAMDVEVEVHATDEHPSVRNHRRVESQWVFFLRTGEARTEVETLLARGRSVAELVHEPHPSTLHTCLALRVDSRGVDIGVLVHPTARLDLEQLEASLSDPGCAEGLLGAILELPEPFAFGPRSFAGEDSVPRLRKVSEASRADVELDLRAFCDTARAEGSPPAWWVGWSLPRAVVLEHVDILGEQLEDAAVALGPTLAGLMWSPDRDLIELSERVEGVRSEQRKTHAEAAARTARWRARRDEEVERSRARARRDRPTLATLFRPRVSRDAGKGDASPRRAGGADGIVQGSKVRVRTGPFAERVGVVSELDGRGGARVMLGLLSTRFALVDLDPIPDPRERPALTSSHRKGNPARKARG